MRAPAGRPWRTGRRGRVDGRALRLAEVGHGEARWPHRDRVRAAVVGAADGDAALRRRLEELRDLAGLQARQVRRDEGDERLGDDLARRGGEGLVPRQSTVVPGEVALERLAADDREPADAGRRGSRRRRARAARASGRRAPRGRARCRGGSSGRPLSPARAHGRPRRDPTPGTYAHRVLDRPLEELLSEARSLRRSPVVTYSPKVFIPLTKLCRDVCHYCTFAAAAAPRRARVPDAGRGARHRARRRRGRLPRGALHARRQAGAPLPRRARGARRARLRDDDRVPDADVPARPRGDRSCSRTRTRA